MKTGKVNGFLCVPKFKSENSYSIVIYFRTDIFKLEVYSSLDNTCRDLNNDTTFITMKAGSCYASEPYNLQQSSAYSR